MFSFPNNNIYIFTFYGCNTTDELTAHFDTHSIEDLSSIKDFKDITLHENDTGSIVGMSGKHVLPWLFLQSSVPIQSVHVYAVDNFEGELKRFAKTVPVHEDYSHTHFHGVASFPNLGLSYIEQPKENSVIVDLPFCLNPRYVVASQFSGSDQELLRKAARAVSNQICIMPKKDYDLACDPEVWEDIYSQRLDEIGVIQPPLGIVRGVPLPTFSAYESKPRFVNFT